ncbi:ring-cleaving dioxygenase [Shimazuella sp. AN120528]|uniref:ring-cleaving dioxygenase n=1 Tax=Shimazuella soli TaxID=1892854 RepID=UPI001F11820C|nr:ring-cleaving dioxygenase [Shimazuella soli]MCH5585480.1 ring-cleaving dioxygenase [Shimazuella soli]
MRQPTAGIHHITAFVQDAQGTVDFYSGILGLRLVKKTINFDAPEVYHLYFGNEIGKPGTIITFFPWAGSRKGRIGGGQVGITTYVVPPNSLDFWKQRLESFNVKVTEVERFQETYLQFQDTEGLRLEIVERESGENSNWSFGNVTTDKAIKGFGGAVLYSKAPEKTAETLESVMGLKRIGEEGSFVRYQATGDIGNIIDIDRSVTYDGIGGAGTVHHIAWRAQTDEEHTLWRTHVENSGYHPTKIIDRQYFHAIYFREHGEILFEIATDPPGFANDEAAENLGEKLMLPAWFEKYRHEIQSNLPDIEVRTLEEDVE